MISLVLTVALVFPVGPFSTQTTRQELIKSVKQVQASLDELAAALTRVKADAWPADCRDLSPEKTVRCAAETFGVSVDQAVAVWQCESNFGVEPPHTDAYHGPFQFTYSTYAGQQASMPDVVKWFELSPAVHDVRSNILTAVAWAARHGWSPWSCA